MKTLKVNFTIPQNVVTALNDRVEKRKRSSFVTMAVREKLQRIENEELQKSLIEGYRATAEEEAALAGEWDGAALEGWPD